jgi:hypothetical protein
VVAHGPVGGAPREKAANAPPAAPQSHDSAPLPQRPQKERAGYVPPAQASAPAPAQAVGAAASAAAAAAAARSDEGGPQSLRGKLMAQGSVQEGGGYVARGGAVSDWTATGVREGQECERDGSVRGVCVGCLMLACS